MDSWEDEGFEPAVPKIKASWEDEEVEGVKDSWEEVEVDKPKAKSEPKAKATKAAAKPTSVEFKEMSEEEKKRAQEEADLANAVSLFGLDKPLDQFSFDSKEDALDYSQRLFSKINKFHTSPFYYEFVDDLFKSLVTNLSTDKMRRLATSFKEFADLKTNEEKALKQKDSKAKAKPGKGKIKVEKDVIKGDFDVFLKDSYNAGGDEDEDEDFM